MSNTLDRVVAATGNLTDRARGPQSSDEVEVVATGPDHPASAALGPAGAAYPGGEADQ